MTWYEILVIVLAVAFVGSMLARYIYKRVKKMPTGECACCQTTKKNSLVKAYHKKYGKSTK